MKKLLTFIIPAALALSLAACQKKQEPPVSTADGETGGNIYHEEIFAEQIADFPEEFTLSDGTTVSKSDLSPDMDGRPTLDFAFIRCAEPIFVTTLDDPDIVDPETFEITLEGYLYYFNGSDAYGYGDYYLCFYPDSTRYKIPVAYDCTDIEMRAIGTERIVCDGGGFYWFRFDSEYGDIKAFKDMFTEDMSCKAAVSFKNIVVTSRGLDGEITDIDLEI
ncbi:MAG: hypothetical protein NC401_18645 [Ruminococcus sp.]|nr:hypothetical protein [Ruminococcus sp.]